jgi:polysaccharide export outer membrane protein
MSDGLSILQGCKHKISTGWELITTVILFLSLLYPVYVQAQTTEKPIQPVLDSNAVDRSLTIQGKVSTDSLYRIGPGDTLSLSVYGLDEFSESGITVRADGMASFPGVGEVQTQGKTVAELQEILTDRLSKLLLNPIVTVNIVDTRPGIVYLAGAVRKPGMYELATRQNLPTDQRLSRVTLHVSNVLALAGGVLTTADLAHVEIRNNFSKQTHQIDLWKMLKQGDTSQDVLLQSGDYINVPLLPEMVLNDTDYILLLNSSIGPQSIPIRVMGFVGTPGLVTLDGSSPYLSSALAKSGGFQVSANSKAVKIKRFIKENQLTTLVVDPNKFDIALRPNDIVEVQESNLAHAGDRGKFTASVLSPFANLLSSVFALSFLTGIHP